MVSALVPGASGLGSSPGRGHCVVFLGKTLNSHSASLTGAPRCINGYGKLLGKTTETGDKLRQLWSTRIERFNFFFFFASV